MTRKTAYRVRSRGAPWALALVAVVACDPGDGQGTQSGRNGLQNGPPLIDPSGMPDPHGPGLEPPAAPMPSTTPAQSPTTTPPSMGSSVPPAGMAPAADEGGQTPAMMPAAPPDPGEGVEPMDPSPDAMSNADAGMPDMSAEAGPGTVPIEPPVADDCITDVSAGDHTFTCGGVTFLVRVSDTCTRFACGLIFDVHGGTMGGAQMRDNTLLHELAPEHGYLVVHPSAGAANTGNSWNQTEQAPDVVDFMQRMIAAFYVDERRVHITGFSQGSAMTFYLLCNHNDLLASAAPVSGATTASECMDADWQPRVPILYMNGTGDTASTIERSRSMIDGIVSRMGLSGGDMVDAGPGYMRVRYQDTGGMEVDYIEHEYGGQAVLGGHCIPGGVDTAGGDNNFVLNATTCTTGPEPRLAWGETVLQWFIDHPRP